MKSATRSANSDFLGTVRSDFLPPTGGVLKRAFDISAAVCGIIFISPIFLMVMLLVKFTDRGPAFYGHQRIGHNGQTFRCLKFRTMVVNGDHVLQDYFRNNPAAYEEWRQTRKLQNDP